MRKMDLSPASGDGMDRRPGIVMDLDGTVWQEGELIPGARECLGWLREHNYPVVYLTNNPIRPELLAGRLADLGLLTRTEEVITACAILKDRLRKTVPGATVFVLADPQVQAQLDPEFRHSDDPAEIDVVIAAPPSGLDYASLSIAFRALRRGAQFVATNGDPFVWTRDRVELPHTAAIIGALEASSKRRVEWIAGKPSPLAAEYVQRSLHRTPAEIIVVGDNLDTDMAFARENGMRPVLVLTGTARREDLHTVEHPPEAALDSVADLPAWLASMWESGAA